jgi:GMP synthase-like glutamine amidotransferase
MSTQAWKPRTLILQHEEASPPGHVATWLDEQQAQVETIRIDEVEPDVDPRDYDLIVSLGSEFAAYDDSIAFVEREVRLFREAAAADVPILGLCFGGQLLSRVLGGKVFRTEQPEIGWLPVRSHDHEVATVGPWFQWHFDSFTLPPGATLLAETDTCVQGFVAGRSLGLQFHPEVTPEIMEEWVRVYPHELTPYGIDPQGLLAETNRRAGESRRAAWRLFDGFRDRIVRAVGSRHGR